MEVSVLKIFVLEDRKSISFSAKKYSVPCDAQFTFFPTLQELRDNLSFMIPDCLILNVIVTEDKLYSFIKELRLGIYTRYIPIIILTSKSLSQDRIIGYDAGCDAYLSMPFDPGELCSLVKNLLRQKQLPTLFIMEMCSLIREIKSLAVDKISSASYPVTKIFFTRQEANVLKKIMEGKTIAQIQEELNTSRRNVEKYLTRLYDKSQISGLKELKSLPWDSILVNLKANDGS
ncbi:TctD-like protein (plastid) [Cryptomonas paramecium]|uniref:TctD-like protein n=1 Tax=Cryptomonas paramaecium TaxID=2898 RepID=D2ISD9_9CRYP|nr:TctD-like protein [Cryptomonas paramecium]ACT46831.1 TctD-like protein [Cryptomonas paramecium]BDA98047.1 TctD-like protein [Cryptomonas paramecium]